MPLSRFALIDRLLVLDADVTMEDLEAAPEFDPEARSIGLGSRLTGR